MSDQVVARTADGEQVQLIFDRWVTKSTPGPFRTRIITDGVIPSLHIDYKGTRIEQYHKEGRALRTETTINNTRDFYIGKSLRNLPALRQIGFQANRRLLQVEQISHDCLLSEDAFQKLKRPIQVDSQRASALRFADPQVQALCGALLGFQVLPTGFTSRNLRDRLAPLHGLQPHQLTQGRMTYQLRRLRLHGIIERAAGSHRYRLTAFGHAPAGSSPAPMPALSAPASPAHSVNFPLPMRPSDTVSINSNWKSSSGRTRLNSPPIT